LRLARGINTADWVASLRSKCTNCSAFLQNNAESLRIRREWDCRRFDSMFFGGMRSRGKFCEGWGREKPRKPHHSLHRSKGWGWGRGDKTLAISGSNPWLARFEAVESWIYPVGLFELIHARGDDTSWEYSEYNHRHSTHTHDGTRLGNARPFWPFSLLFTSNPCPDYDVELQSYSCSGWMFDVVSRWWIRLMNNLFNLPTFITWLVEKWEA